MGGPLRARLQWVNAQAGHLRRLLRDSGLKGALAERSGAVVATSPQWQAEMNDIALLRAEVVRLAHRLGDAFVSLEEGDRSMTYMAARTTALELAGADSVNALQAVSAALQTASALQAAQAAEAHRLNERVGHLEQNAAALQHIVTDWLWAANAPLRNHPVVSVIMPTAFPERLGFLQSAITSVLAQSYANWELIVLDDGLEPFLDPLPPWWPKDARVRLIRGSGRSEGNARNQALAAAQGEIAAFLDDDCRWFPWWLHAVARAFGEDPELGIVHGIRVVEGDPGGDPWTYAQSLDELTLHTANPADTNVMAYRLGLAGSEWPPLSSCADYDTVIRLRSHGAKFLPVPAATYAVSSPDRAWAPERAKINAENFRIVQRRARSARPLRIVAHNGLYPLLSETYIGDELEALRRHDIDIVLSRHEASSVSCPSRIDVPLFESLQSAIEHHDPDLVLMHWAGVGLANREACAAAGIPYGIRIHSFDAHHTTQELINAWCAGIWAFPHYTRDHHLAFALDTLLVDVPCGGSGALRRNPEARWRDERQRLEGLPPLQETLLRRSLELCADGGRAIYATCSLLRAENEAVVEKILAEGGCESVPVKLILGKEKAERVASPCGRFVKLLPHKHGTDGFFAAVLKRSSSRPRAGA